LYTIPSHISYHYFFSYRPIRAETLNKPKRRYFKNYFSQVAVSVFWHPTSICPWAPTTTLKKNSTLTATAYYKVPNTKQPIKLWKTFPLSKL
jgi:hypothetical protein